MLHFFLSNFSTNLNKIKIINCLLTIYIILFQISYHSLLKIITQPHCRQNLIGTTICPTIGNAFHHSNFSVIHTQQTQTTVTQIGHIQFREVFQES